jgi:hypothetical protein
VCLFLCFVGSAASYAKNQVSVGFDNRYISEGRDNLQSGGIYWASWAKEFNDNVLFASTYGWSEEGISNYDELNLTLIYQNSWAGIGYSFSATRIEFFADDLSDNEIGLDLTWLTQSGAEPFFNFVYSTEQNGYFTTLGVSTQYQLNPKVTLAPYLSGSYDNGYIVEANSGYTSTNVGAVMTFSWNQSLLINLQLEQSIGGHLVRVEPESKNDIFWFGMHLVTKF